MEMPSDLLFLCLRLDAGIDNILEVLDLENKIRFQFVILNGKENTCFFCLFLNQKHVLINDFLETNSTFCFCSS